MRPSTIRNPPLFDSNDPSSSNIVPVDSNSADSIATSQDQKIKGKDLSNAASSIVTTPQHPASVHAAKGTFWNRHSTIINFWLDVLLAVIFVVQAWMFAVLHVVFPRGAGPEWTIWKATRLDWSEALFVVFCIFAIGIVIHVMFHWAWICGVISTRLLRIKPRRDDGTQTLIGVGFLVLLIHLVIVGILLTRINLVRSI